MLHEFLNEIQLQKDAEELQEILEEEKLHKVEENKEKKVTASMMMQRQELKADVHIDSAAKCEICDEK